MLCEPVRYALAEFHKATPSFRTQSSTMSNILVQQSAQPIVNFRGVPRAATVQSARSGRWPLAIGRLEGWIARSRQRRELGDLAETSADLLRDIGLTYAEARREAEKPFWR